MSLDIQLKISEQINDPNKHPSQSWKRYFKRTEISEFIFSGGNKLGGASMSKHMHN